MFLLREGVVIKHYIDDTLFFAYPNVCCRMEIYYYCPLNPVTGIAGKASYRNAARMASAVCCMVSAESWSLALRKSMSPSDWRGTRWMWA